MGARACRLAWQQPDDWPDHVCDDVDFADAKVPVSMLPITGRLLGIGFELVDLLIFLERPPDASPAYASSSVRLALPTDVDDVVAVAGDSFHADRFHRDRRIDKRIADDIKRRWVENYFKGLRGEQMWVTIHDGNAVGFLLMAGGPSGTSVIDLLAVRPEHRGGGHAAALLGAFVQHCANIGHVAGVGTQVSNDASLRAYARAGFTPRSAELVLHYHRH